MDLRTLQAEHKSWVARNFPGQQPYEPLLGLVEEVGELSHAHLKAIQGIRGTLEELNEKKQDAVGDIVIFLCSYCNANKIDLEEAVTTAWEEVKDRDWQANPMGEGY